MFDYKMNKQKGINIEFQKGNLKEYIVIERMKLLYYKILQEIDVKLTMATRISNILLMKLKVTLKVRM